jgi:hypothetical protein
MLDVPGVLSVLFRGQKRRSSGEKCPLLISVDITVISRDIKLMSVDHIDVVVRYHGDAARHHGDVMRTWELMTDESSFSRGVGVGEPQRHRDAQRRTEKRRRINGLP